MKKNPKKIRNSKKKSKFRKNKNSKFCFVKITLVYITLYLKFSEPQKVERAIYVNLLAYFYFL